ncbi:hypothetical protein ACFTSF_27495 [Kribbella sp. NPDC056951]|uniref:hypothetical protein n=1 Tax=Kribbella sp. NPDC056951 TaxID=3345978 RepID=UPI00363D326B
MNVIRAELAKLRTLPITTFTITGTIAVALLIAIALERSGEPVDVVPYVQAGFVLLGIIPVAHEYAGRQFGTTLLAVPARGQLLIGKTVATLITLALTAIATALAQEDRPVGAAAYLTLIGLLAYAVALLVRHLVPALVGMLCLVLIVSPLLAAVTEHARWLPDRAAAELYRPTDSVLTATTGTLVAGAWITVLAAVAIRRFHRRDG